MGSAAGTTTHLGGRLEEFDSHLVGKSAGILRQNHLSGPYDIVAAGNLLPGSVVNCDIRNNFVSDSDPGKK